MRSIPVNMCVLGLLLKLSDASAAEDPAKTLSRALVREGNALLDKHKYQQALDKFEQAYLKCQSPKIFFNQAQALQGLERHLDALRTYQRFLDGAGDAALALRQDAQRQVESLSEKVGRIEVRSNRQGALVRLNGSELGTTPLAGPSLVEPGNHQIDVEWRDEHKTLSVVAAPGSLTSAEANFEPRPGKLSLLTNRPGAIIRVDDKEVGKTPLAAPLDMPPGRHRLNLEWQNQSKTAEFTLLEEGSATLLFDFEDKRPVVFVQPAEPPPPWYKNRWVWAGGVAVATVAAAALIMLSYGQDHYPSPAFGTQTVGR